MSIVKLVWITPEAEKIIGYCARVSNPANQDNPDVKGLLRYCMKHGHWSVFEMASMCVEITTSRAISAQVLRHRSFSFQEFSQRYAETYTILPTTPRRQDYKNRQNSFDDVDADTLTWWDVNEYNLHEYSLMLYRDALSKGIAKESARMLLPLATETKLYMSGSIRSWIHYFQLRCASETQREHREIANEIRELFKQECPIIGELI